MPLDPKHVQAVFLSAVKYHDPAARALVLDRECSTDAELRRRVEALLRAHDQSDSRLDRPIVGVDVDEIVSIAEREEDGLGIAGAVSPIGASDRSDPTVGLQPDADLSVAAGARSGGNNPVVPSIEGYEILEELGRGGMGVVYKARQVLLNRPCALKMILGGALAGPNAFVRFLAEAQAIARLHHPHIVQIHHIGEAEGLPFFELEYVEGGGLDKTLDGTPWDARRAAGLVETLAGAVAEAHRHGDRPSRPEAGQHPADGRRHAQDRRLRPGQVARQRLRADGDRLDHGLAQLHGPRAGRGPDQANRPAGRHLRPGGDPVRAADRTPAVPGYVDPGDAGSGQDRRARAAVAAGPRPATRRRDDRAEVLAEGAGEALRLGRRAGRGPPAIPRRRADRGAAGPGLGAGLALVPATPCPGRPDRGGCPRGRRRVGRHPLAVERSGQGPRSGLDSCRLRGQGA